jgi:hypothetical protein
MVIHTEVVDLITNSLQLLFSQIPVVVNPFEQADIIRGQILRKLLVELFVNIQLDYRITVLIEIVMEQHLVKVSVVPLLLIALSEELFRKR